MRKALLQDDATWWKRSAPNIATGDGFEYESPQVIQSRWEEMPTVMIGDRDDIQVRSLNLKTRVFIDREIDAQDYLAHGIFVADHPMDVNEAAPVKETSKVTDIRGLDITYMAYL